MFLYSCPEFTAPEVILSGQGLSPLFGPSGPKVKYEAIHDLIGRYILLTIIFQNAINTIMQLRFRPRQGMTNLYRLFTVKTYHVRVS